jgi:hypothetical protein
VIGASSPITVNWRLYVGPLNGGNTAYIDWFVGLNLNNSDQFTIKTLNGAVETTHVTIGTKASIDAYLMINNDGYISGSFNYTAVNGQIKLKLTRTLNPGAGVSNFNKNQIALDQTVIHYQNRNGSTNAYNNYFDPWVYNSSYTVSDGWMTFTTGQLFIQGEQVSLDLQSILG